MLSAIDDRGKAKAILGIVWREIRSRPGRFTVSIANSAAILGTGTITMGEVVGIVGLGGVIGASVLAETALPVSIVSEGPYIGKNAQSALSVARTGAALESVAAHVLGESDTRTISPGSWRKILGISAKDRDEAKDRSLAEVPLLLPGMRELLDVLGRVDHLTDAGGVSLVGSLCEAWNGTALEWAARIGGATAPIPRARAGRPGRS